ncbi:MAG: hypothetical protein EBX92_03440 [Actinobacteria bacterium]|nr:hypothetical protein [Actinomycetota bacterium]
MEPEPTQCDGSFARVIEDLNAWFFPRFSAEVSRLKNLESSTIGSPSGALGQIPYNCALRYCCEYATNNGQRHLGALARALDCKAGDPIRARIRETRKLVDHSNNMHRIARATRDIACSTHPDLQSIEFRFATTSGIIDTFTSDELSADSSILLILNHLLHQSSQTKTPVPHFVSQAFDNISRLAERSGASNVYGISIEPARLKIGFGASGLINEVHKYRGAVVAEAEIPGDRAGKSVTTFRF